jgi:membrane protease YdiL (CAAX protease family)
METIPSRRALTERPRYPWKIFWLLLFASAVGVAALLPYLLAFFQKVLATNALPMPLPVLMAVQIMQSAILFAAFISLGLVLAPKAGIELPILQRWFYNRTAPLPNNFVRTPLIAGVVMAAILLLVFYTLFFPRIPEWPVDVEAAMPIWKRLLSCLYGAINEEIVARLFVLSLLLWLLRKIGRQRSPQASPVIFWTANLIVAGLFAVGHIPAAKVFLPITPLVIVALLTINGSASLLFGYFCWKRGLEAAMLAHFSADFTLHVIGPMFFRS